MILEEYVDSSGHSPFATWFDRLDAIAAAKIVVALGRLERGATSNVKAVGAGVAEFKIDFGPGYRVYFGQDGGELVILLVGGTKVRQQRDIETANAHWHDYKVRKKGTN